MYYPYLYEYSEIYWLGLFDGYLNADVHLTAVCKDLFYFAFL